LKLAHTWSNHSRITGGVDDYRGEDSEDLVVFAKQYLQEHPEIDFFVFGHRHIMLDLQLSQRSRVIILGDWLQYFSYGVFDGERFKLEMFEADENISQ
jgi:UDP-2,3-diacylglucosamine hydrolase